MRNERFTGKVIAPTALKYMDPSAALHWRLMITFGPVAMIAAFAGSPTPHGINSCESTVPFASS